MQSIAVGYIMREQGKKYLFRCVLGRRKEQKKKKRVERKQNKSGKKSGEKKKECKKEWKEFADKHRNFI